MTITIFRNEEGINLQEVVNRFKSSLIDKKSFKKDEVEVLVNLFAKNPVDKFIVSEFPDVEVAQGDILIWPKGTDMYNDYINDIKNLKPTESMILQQSDSITGDHKVIPLNNSNLTLMEGTITPKFMKNLKSGVSNKTFIRALILKSEKPFLIIHREHGNIALPAGEYMICSQLDPRTLKVMID